MKAYYLKARGRDLLISDLFSVSMDRQINQTDFTVVSSGALSSEEEHKVIDELDLDAEFSVSRWIQDKRYFVRLILCSILFLLSYLVCSLAIRDPIPMIDELAISFALSFLLWQALSKNDLKAKAAVQANERLRKSIAHYDCLYSKDLLSLEEFYAELVSMERPVLVNSIASGLLKLPASISPDFLQPFRLALEGHLSMKEKRLMRILKNRPPVSKLLTLSEDGLDLPLLGFSMAVLGK